MMEISIHTPEREVILDITREIRNALHKLKFEDGLCCVFVPHTTAGVTLNENADPSVKRDMIDMFRRLIPQDTSFEHLEGNSDAHIKSTLVGHSVTVMVQNGSLQLGRWQGIQFCEFDGPRNRKITIKCISSA